MKTYPHSVIFNFAHNKNLHVCSTTPVSMASCLAMFGFIDKEYFLTNDNKLIFEQNPLPKKGNIDVHVFARTPPDRYKLLRGLQQIVISGKPVLETDNNACSYCHCREAIFSRRLCLGKGESDAIWRICERCLVEDIEWRVRATLQWFKLITKNDRVLIPISGEKDSAAELFLVSSMFKFPAANIKALFLDRGLGQYDYTCWQAASSLAGITGIELIRVNAIDEFGAGLSQIYDKCKKHRLDIGPCQLCGMLRGSVIAQIVHSGRFTCITQGTHQTDLVRRYLQCQLFNGQCLSGFKNGQQFDQYGIKYLYPLMALEEKEVALYCHLKKLPVSYHDDIECSLADSFPMRPRIASVIRKFEHHIPGCSLNWVRSLESNSQVQRPTVSISKKKHTCSLCGRFLPGRNIAQETCGICKLFLKIRLKIKKTKIKPL
ncbi:MAG: hypothetical protein ABIH18_08085 [Candidatus Omnitrophota bacterium]